jgi:hypothetical protein
VHISLQSPFPKGEVYIGHADGGYGVSMGAKEVRSSVKHVLTVIKQLYKHSCLPSIKHVFTVIKHLYQHNYTYVN